MVKAGPLKAVILGAGNGSRLAPLTHHRPKPLITVGGKPLLHHAIQSLVQAGIQEIAVVVGHLWTQIAEWIDPLLPKLPVSLVYCPSFREGNAASLYAAREFVGDSFFILSMADHIFPPSLPRRLLRMRGMALCVDPSMAAEVREDDTRVWIERGGRVVSIGKGLTRWNAVDAGVFLLGPPIFSAIEELRGDAFGGLELSRAVSRLLDKGYEIYACDISDCFWMDVDTPEDLLRARRIWEVKHRWPATKRGWSHAILTGDCPGPWPKR
jgi:choline kinase